MIVDAFPPEQENTDLPRNPAEQIQEAQASEEAKDIPQEIKDEIVGREVHDTSEGMEEP
jgi:hypothetical protein